jgi:cerevisin
VVGETAPYVAWLLLTLFWLDSGIYTEHTEFGGRAHWGATFGTYFDGDFDGHGTLVSSMAVGAHYGVATAANVIAVKVWDHAKYAKISDVLASFEWLVAAYLVSENLGIVNLSWTADPSPSLTKAAIQTIAVGLHFIGEMRPRIHDSVFLV